MNRVRTALAVLLAAFQLIGCHDPDDYDQTSEQVARIITLDAESEPQVPADGYSTVTLVAVISPANAVKRTLEFTATAGQLVYGGVQPANGVTSVVAGPSGVVHIDLRSPQAPQVATVAVRVKDATNVGAELNVDFVPITPDAVIRFSAVPEFMPADGRTQEFIEVAVATGIPVADRKVTFTTSRGSFSATAVDADIEVQADADGIARADFYSATDVGVARITATVKGILRQAALEFRRALPEAIEVITSTQEIKPKTGLLITADLLRESGKVTDGTIVKFSAVRAGTAERIGEFRNVTRSTNGAATATFLIEQTDYTGRIEVIAGVEGSAVVGSTDLYVVP